MNFWWTGTGLVQWFSYFAWTRPGTPTLNKNKSVRSLILRTTLTLSTLYTSSFFDYLPTSSCKRSLWATPNGNKNIKSAKYYAFDLPDEEVVEKVERMRRAVTKNYGIIKLPSCLDRLSLLGLRECNGSSYVLQQSKKHLGMVQCTFVVFFLTFFSRLHVELCWTNWAKKPSLNI